MIGLFFTLSVVTNIFSTHIILNFSTELVA
uniref:Uncharacterized protein n=1 Tax=Rhizophora mucronata TaxID=61149 RepID=A0A2P2IZM3_RHIMU